VIVGGVEDHVHLLGRLSRTIALADWVRQLKSRSTIWLKERDRSMDGFSWQGGYGAFAVDAGGVERVRAYIGNQAEHHRVVTFQEEYRKILTEYGIEWDEQYVWG
jgi:REP element-mobilizing transposase RayT